MIQCFTRRYNLFNIALTYTAADQQRPIKFPTIPFSYYNIVTTFQLNLLRISWKHLSLLKDTYLITTATGRTSSFDERVTGSKTFKWPNKSSCPCSHWPSIICTINFGKSLTTLMSCSSSHSSWLVQYKCRPNFDSSLSS